MPSLHVFNNISLQSHAVMRVAMIYHSYRCWHIHCWCQWNWLT